MVTGGVLYDLNENFVRSWEKIPMGISSKKEAEEFVRQRREIKRSVFKPDKTKGTVLNAQILCTQPEFGLEEIKGFYYRLSELSTSYLYIENQYFRWPPLAEKLAKWGQKMAEQGREDRLCVFVVTNTSKEGLGNGRINTDRMFDILGRRDVMPGVGKQREIGRIKKELDKQATAPCGKGYTFQQRRQVVALMGIGGSNVQFLDIAFLIDAGMLFVTESVEAVFLCPTGIFIFTRCGLAADLSFFIDFYGLTLFAAGGLNNGGVNDGGGCFLYF